MNVSQLNHLRSNKMIKFKTELVGGKECEIVSYMIGDKELWDDPAALETRGNVYDVETGECICACLPKFFNVGERADTSADLIKNQYIYCLEKRDGSMITPVLIDGKIYWKTKKSFSSDVAVLATKLVTPEVIAFSSYYLHSGYTPIFEFTHPNTRIVLSYDNEPHFTLVAIRNQETGEFLSWSRIKHVIKYFNEYHDAKLPIVKDYDKAWSEIIHDVENATDIEGYVLILKDGRRVKIKTAWYLQQHRLMTDLRERDVAEAAADETLDDIKSQMAMANLSLVEIEEIETRVAEEIVSLRDQVSHLILANLDKSIKDVAIEMKGHPLFSLIMVEKRGKEPNYVDYWKRNLLNNYSLRSIKNSNF
jgi:RNA ligase